MLLVDYKILLIKALNTNMVQGAKTAQCVIYSYKYDIVARMLNQLCMLTRLDGATRFAMIECNAWELRSKYERV